MSVDASLTWQWQLIARFMVIMLRMTYIITIGRQYTPEVGQEECKSKVDKLVQDIKDHA